MSMRWLQEAVAVGPPSPTNLIGRHQRIDPVAHRISDQQLLNQFVNSRLTCADLGYDPDLERIPGGR